MNDWLPTGWQKVAALVLAATASWLLIRWIDFGSPRIADLRVERALLATIDQPTIDNAANATFAPAQTPYWAKGRFGVLRIEFDVADPNTSDLALLILRARDNFAVYVNGKLGAPTPGMLGQLSTLHGIHPRLIGLLPSLLRTGRNTIDIVVARNAPRAVVYAAHLGPSARLLPAHRHAMIVAHDSGLLAAIVAGIVLLFALALSSIIRNPALILTIALTLGFTMLNELYGLWVGYPWPQDYRNAAVVLIGIPLWASCGAFANEWTGGPAIYRRWFFTSAILSCLLTVVCFAVLSPSWAIEAGSVVETAMGAMAIGFMVQRFARHYYAAPASAAAEIFVACVGLMLAIALLLTQAGFLPTIDDFTSIQGGVLTKLCTISLILFIAIGLARHGIGVYHLAALNNETFARKVDEKQRELEANHALLRSQDRERALHTERGRIMRDVHDGIGSQLQGLLARTRVDEARDAPLATGLQTAIDDLHLIVDSLDRVDGSLETALETFRALNEPKCKAAGIAIDWQVERIGQTKSIGPAAVLQIYRVLQEALSNAIRHGAPQRITLGLHLGRDPETVEVSLKDDGRGFETPKNGTHGRGLANMRRRAESIGAKLAIGSGTEGTLVTLTLPR
jgi:two-component system, NarL family, sensor histidine kinase UhpB